MHNYDYQCQSCEHKFEKFQSITADPVRKCPTCGENKVRRLIGAGGAVIFKGSGFYATDYRSESYKSAAKADSESPTKKSAKSPDGPSTKSSGGASAKGSDGASTKIASKSDSSSAKTSGGGK